jgi:hypothetical protein
MKRQKIVIDISEADGWVRLDVEGDIQTSYPIFGDEISTSNNIDKFSKDLKKALSGKRISTLS